MAPDGTVAFPTFATVNAELRVAVQLRPPGGPLADVQLLSPPGATLGSGLAMDVGGDGRFVGAWVENGDVKVATLMPGSTSFTPTTTLTTDTADGANVQVDGAGNAYVMWSTRDDDAGANTRTARVRLTKFPAGGGAPSTSLVDENVTTFAQNPVLAVAFRVDDAGDAVFVKTRGTINSTTQATAIDYTGWTQPAGGSPTLPTTLTSTSTTDGNVNTAGESSLTSLNLDINNGGEIMASWFRSASPFANSTVDVVNGTVAAGFGSIEHPTPGDTLFYTDVTSLVDMTGRTTVAVLKNIGGKIRTQVYTRPRAGSWSSAQTPIPTGDNQFGNELAADPNGRVMLVFQFYNGPSTIVTAFADPGQPFSTPTPLASGLASLQRAIPAFGASGDGVVSWVFDENAVQVTDAAGYDVSPPQLRSLMIPASGTVGSPLDFTVAPVDIWGPITTTSWAFGDDSTGDGSSVSHIYATPGDRTASVTATDSVGNSASASGPVSVTSLPVVTTGPPPLAPDTTPPAISAFAASPSTFAVGSKSTPLVAKVARGTTFKFSLSEPAAIAITVARQIPGRRSGNRCVPATRKLRKKKACKAYKTVGTLKRAGVAGANKVAFTGKLGKRALGVGRYRATIVATDAAGNKSKAANTPFRIVPASQR